MASDEFLVRFKYWLARGGIMTLRACGIIISCRVLFGLLPNELAASVCPCGTATMPALTISAMKAAV